ncbi:FAD dependent oxidoreductase [Rhodocollybia butyracea]|uniref:FAD dependent oxidoreductase n=1 Tax=Rhodocollybia butyracea TaxID=206335 RepID=A0A9P5PT23_9AGAR|nr:FAD dependent oxidoreductase [Rhodocollybia butyracea]
MQSVATNFNLPKSKLQASKASFNSSSPRFSSYLPVPNPTKSFWIDSPDANPLATEGSTGILPQEADICIIGSGITGVSVAYHLAAREHRPLKLVILEARDFCSGATGRNGGHLTPNMFIDFCDFKEQYGQQEALKALKLEQHTATSILQFISAQNFAESVDLVAGDHITTFLTDEELLRAKADYDATKAAGVDLSDVDWLSKEEMQAAHGVDYPGVKFRGHNLWPLKLVTHLYTYAKSQTNDTSLSLHTSTPVTRISSTEPASSHRWKLDTPRGSISCSYVVHATNAYASHLLPNLRGPSGIVPTRGQVVAVRAAVSLNELGGKSSWDANDGLEYWFPRPVSSAAECPLIILGGGREAEPRFEDDEIDDSKCNEAVGKVLRDFLPELFPGKYKEGREPEMDWTGIMGFTFTKDPFVGPVSASTEFQGQYIAAGYSGHGMPRAYACAEAVAEMITADIRGERWNAPDWLPEHYLRLSNA